MPLHTQREEDIKVKVCVRCGVEKSKWKGRWQDPLCTVYGTTYDQHLEELNK